VDIIIQFSGYRYLLTIKIINQRFLNIMVSLLRSIVLVMPHAARCLVVLCLLPLTVLADVSIKVNSGVADVDTNILAHIGKIAVADIKQNDLLVRRRILKHIDDATHALGYYGATAEIEFLQDESIQVNVTLGRPVLWGEVNVSVIGPAENLIAIQKVVAAPLLKTGERAQHWQYEQTKKELTQLLARFGYMDARIDSSEVKLNLQKLRADVSLIAVSGERYRFGEVKFEQEGLDDSLLHRLMPFESGELYDNEKVTLFRKELALSGYFEDAQVLIKKQEKYRVDVLALLKVKEAHYLDVGLGYSTDSGPRAKLGWRWPVAGSFGGSLTSTAEVSNPKKEVGVNYRIPLVKPLTQSLDFETGWQDKTVENTRTILTTLGMAFNNRRKTNWQHRYAINIDHERNSSDFVNENGEAETTEVASFFLVPSASWSRSESNEERDPDSGYYVRFGVQGSHPALGSDTEFLRGTFGVRWLTKVFSPKAVFVARLDMGAIAADDIEQVPFSRRFFAGGDQSIRGYEYESLGTRDEEGNLIGGKYLNVGGLELNYRIFDEWRTGVFFDTGRAFTSTTEPFYSSVGPSARWISPVGQIRLDLAFPLDGEDAGTPRVHISMGGVF
jgi:translocation and assembly module TamA